MTARLAMIAAVARNDVIGAEGGMPWSLPSDLAFFKRVTMGKPVIMGRRTFETFGKPLKGRTNIVVTTDRDYEAAGAEVVHSLDDAIEVARKVAMASHADEIFVIGGGQIYRRAIDKADRLYITHVEAEPEGDTVFPAIDPEKWAGFTSADAQPGEADTADYTVRIYERRAP